MESKFDVAIIGGGFAGSILATVLARSGRRVILVDAGSHPRFAVGESSTPLADSILKSLGREYAVPEFCDLASYGRWKRTQPDVACGLKRGFTYYQHADTATPASTTPASTTPASTIAGGPRPSRGDFRCTATHRYSMVVAASASDSGGDTHWYRPDVDHHLWTLAERYGVVTRSPCRVVGLDRSCAASEDSDFGSRLLTLDDGSSVAAERVIDASGTSGVAARILGQREVPLSTSTRSTFAHFRGLARWTDVARQECRHDPFDADASAQHHVIGNRWLWVLRFDNGITSVGLTTPVNLHESRRHESQRHQSRPKGSQFGLRSDDRTRRVNGARELFSAIESSASLRRLFVDATPVTPVHATVHNQRFYDPLWDRRVVMLPTAAATLDPLHSTGIAHALSGVARVAHLIDTRADTRGWDAYRAAVIREVQFLDDLIATAYQVMSDFPRFCAAAMVYFTAVITCEERVQRGERLGEFFGTHDAELVQACHDCCRMLRGDRDAAGVVDRIARRMEPWNRAGLFAGPEACNRYAYTATKG